MDRNDVLTFPISIVSYTGQSFVLQKAGFSQLLSAFTATVTNTANTAKRNMSETMRRTSFTYFHSIICIMQPLGYGTTYLKMSGTVLTLKHSKDL